MEGGSIIEGRYSCLEIRVTSPCLNFIPILIFFLVMHVLLAEVINSNYKVRIKKLEFILHSIQTFA